MVFQIRTTRIYLWLLLSKYDNNVIFFFFFFDRQKFILWDVYVHVFSRLADFQDIPQ